MEARGEKGTGTIGDILALRAQVRGAAPSSPTAASATSPPWRPWTCPPTRCTPRSWAAGTSRGTRTSPSPAAAPPCSPGTSSWRIDGILVIPPALADELADDSIAQEREETFIAEMVQQGHSVDGSTR